MSTDRTLVSTAIPYVNATPHLGFAYEALLADVLARHSRARGREVRFVTGSDEHSLKNVLAAERAGVPVADFVRAHAERFAALGAALDLSTNVFVRTSEPRHRLAVERLWRALEQSGDLYRATYEGRYCGGCERFVDEREERCDEHPALALETLREENWYFRLSRYGERLVEALETGRIRVEPETYRREALALARAGLPDVSVSRSACRARGWAFAVPGDASQVVWVWLDALVSYATAVGFGDDEPAFDAWWRGASERVHVVGKGIHRFHTTLWPALLAAAHEPWPTRVVVHGYVTVEGQKISKSGAAALDPFELAERFGVDALRWYLLRHLPPDRDGDFSLERFTQVHDSELANQLGNLVARTLALIERTTGEVPRSAGRTDREQALAHELDTLATRIDVSLDRFEPHEALASIARAVAHANTYADRTAPWALAKQGRTAELATALHHLAEAVRVIAIALVPFLPGTADAIAERLGARDASELGVARVGNPLASPVRPLGPLFARIAQR